MKTRAASGQQATVLDYSRRGINSALDARRQDQSVGAGSKAISEAPSKAPYRRPMIAKGPALSAIAAMGIATTSTIQSDTNR